MRTYFVSRTLLALSLGILATAAKADTIIFQSNLSLTTAPSPSPTGGNRFQLNVNGGSVQGITSLQSSPGVQGYNFVYDNAAHSILNGASNDSGGIVKMDSNIVDDPFDTQDNHFFLALDGVYHTAAIDISIATVAGQSYTVSFDWGGVQQAGFLGTTTDSLTVGLSGGVASQTTSPVTVPEQGFSGWLQVTDTFVANITGTSILSFLANGSPTGPNQEPAFSVLDNITVSQPTVRSSPVPEPGSLFLLSTGLIGVGSVLRLRYKK
jgi:hypothetical protein